MDPGLSAFGAGTPHHVLTGVSEAAHDVGEYVLAEAPLVDNVPRQREISTECAWTGGPAEIVRAGKE